MQSPILSWQSRLSLSSAFDAMPLFLHPYPAQHLGLEVGVGVTIFGCVLHQALGFRILIELSLLGDRCFHHIQLLCGWGACLQNSSAKLKDAAAGLMIAGGGEPLVRALSLGK